MKTENQNRLMSLDALRGFDMMFIMGLSGLIVAICHLIPTEFTQAIADSMGHVKWDGLHHHDTIFPLFLFLAGVSFPYSYAKQQSKGMNTKQIYLKIFRRTLMLILLGAVYNGLFKFDFANLRIASVLARIGIAWMFAAILYIHFGVRSRIGIALTLLIGYALLSKYVGAPDVPGADPLSKEGCLVGYIDRCFLPGKLYSKTFDPEGLLSAVPAIVTAMLGMFSGEFIRSTQFNITGSKKALYMFVAAIILGVIAACWNPWLPINKALWSSSFVCAVGSYSLALMALFYYIIDVRKKRSLTLFFRVIGMNSITIYLAQKIVDFGHISDFFLSGLIALAPENIGAIIDKAGYVMICWLFLYFLYRKNIFLKV